MCGFLEQHHSRSWLLHAGCKSVDEDDVTRRARRYLLFAQAADFSWSGHPASRQGWEKKLRDPWCALTELAVKGPNTFAMTLDRASGQGNDQR